jgi:nicotinate dehydrogenase subunit A
MDDERADLAATVLVNGQRREVRTEPDTALLYVLRNHLGLNGTRFGCGLGLCGACLVLVDGQVTYSCDTPVWAVRDKEITTVEGLGTSDQPHPVIRALIARQGAQCGYCLSGVIIAAVGLLRRNADPSGEEVRAALDGNLCRCGAHNRIVQAVLDAAAELRADPEGTA